MSTAETNIVNKIRIASAKLGTTLFRNSKGLFFTKDGRRVAGGLIAQGSADLIGIKCVKITPEMVGGIIGVFVALEIKTATGKASAEQLQFIEFVKFNGGIAGVCHSESDAITLLS